MLRKRGKNKGLTCIALDPEGFGLAHVMRGEDQRPQLQACDYRAVGPGADLEVEIAMALRDYQLRGNPGVVVLSDHSYSLRMVDAPDVGAEFMKEAVRYSIADLIDFDVDEAVLDLFTLPDQDDGRPKSLYVAAARANEIQELADSLNDAGLKLAAIDISELALRNIAALTPEDESGVALVYLRNEGGLITLTRALIASDRSTLSISSLVSVSLRRCLTTTVFSWRRLICRFLRPSSRVFCSAASCIVRIRSAAAASNFF